MIDTAAETLPINIEEEMRQSYLDYAMSVIVGRALPDVRDGLKPVHRRVLFAMRELGNDWNKPYKKSARVVGDVIGKYHPHGDTAVYDTIVRMAQPFSLRYMLVDGQGNFGSIDGDNAAAMRYTEVRMAKIAHELLTDIDKETVDFVPNYDESEQEPEVLPTRLPNLLVNGSAGIAVGMATNIPPHNLTEVINGALALIDTPDIDINTLLSHIPGPDFPTAAIINGKQGIQEAYTTGRGRIYVRARHHTESMESGRERIVVTELPYQVNKAKLLEKIAELVKEKRLEGISELRDESDKEGMRMVIELKRGEMSEVVLNHLYKHTQLQSVFGINMVALHNGQPRLLTLKEILQAFISHRREVVTRRTLYELRKARERAHILEGLAVALANIDPIIALIKAAPTPSEAKEQLLAQLWEAGVVLDMLERAGAAASRPEEMDQSYGLVAGRYRLSPVQAQAILDLRLHRLTGLEQDRIVAEYRQILERIAELLEILGSESRLMEVIREELIAIREQFGDERRTEIQASQLDVNIEDLINREDLVVTLSHEGYAKTQPLTDYRAQKRGGRGRSAAATKDDDFIDKMFVAHSHDTILCFSSLGRLYWLKVYEIPQGGHNSRGRPIVNLLSLQEGERITAFLPIDGYEGERFVFMATAHGTVKKTPLSAFANPRSIGIIAIELVEGDQLVGVAITDGEQEVMLFSSEGKAVRFREGDVRSMGRVSRGVRGIALPEAVQVVGLIIVQPGLLVLSATENGYGKCTVLEEFPTKGRATKGVIAIQTSERNGRVIATTLVDSSDEVMFITNGGTLVRIRVDEISVVGRNTQGVKLINLGNSEKLIALERIAESDAANGDEDEEEGELPESATATEITTSEGIENSDDL
ncbi:DNA gyrase subunit A [Ectothiorhodospiraceae bacterium BW-2]|nr:DNA gyrase subunit A [Ectothiorhodospiraceae bacterium BW-2]